MILHPMTGVLIEACGEGHVKMETWIGVLLTTGQGIPGANRGKKESLLEGEMLWPEGVFQTRPFARFLTWTPLFPPLL